MSWREPYVLMAMPQYGAGSKPPVPPRGEPRKTAPGFPKKKPFNAPTGVMPDPKKFNPDYKIPPDRRPQDEQD